MKTRIQFSILSAFLTLACTSNSDSLSSKQGPDVSGGGDTLVMNFKMAANTVCDYLRKVSDQNRFGLDPATYCNSVKNVKVSSQQKTFLDDGTEVDAINFPGEEKILLSQDRNYLKNYQDLVQLAAHEYVSILGLDDKNYQISGPLSSRIDVQEDLDPVPGPCLQISGTFRCEHREIGTFSISTEGDEYKTTGFNWLAKDFKADGIERLISFEKAGPDRDVAHEAYLKAVCLKTGLELHDRGTNFSGKQKNGKYEFGWWGYTTYRLLFEPTLNQFTWYSSGHRVYPNGQAADFGKSQYRCRKIAP